MENEAGGGKLGIRGHERTQGGCSRKKERQVKGTGACCAERREMCRGRDMWEAGDIVAGRKVVAQANDGNVDSLIAWHSFELGLLLSKMH